MKKCPQCGKANPDNAKKCFECREDISTLKSLTQEIEENDTENKDTEDEIVFGEVRKLENKDLDFYLKKAFYFFPIFVILIGIFMSVVAASYFSLNNNLIKGIASALIILIASIFVCMLSFWLIRFLEIFKDISDKLTKKEEKEHINTEINE